MADQEQERAQERLAGGPEHQLLEESFVPNRRRLPDTRQSITHKFSVNGMEGYAIVSYYAEDGRPAELFLKVAKEGSTLGGLMNVIGIQTSMLLQHGVPVKTIASKLKGTRFDPSGFTKNPDVKDATSLVDYVFRWMEHEFP